MRHFLSIQDVAPDELHRLVELSLAFKAERVNGSEPVRLTRRVLGLFFQKPSLRTRVSFETAMAHLGGSCVFLSGTEVGLGTREPVADFARVVSRYLDVFAARTFAHDLLVELARNASCPVINALSDELHPCQALADFCTIHELFGRIKGTRLAYIGDGNNVARSLAMASAYLGATFVLSAPGGYEFSSDFLAEWQRPEHAGRVEIDGNPQHAVAGADVVYTDVWASMGQEHQASERRHAFAAFQVNERLFAYALPSARFLHCLPAHRGEEVTAEVIDGARSAVLQQAENRLHAQKALIYWLLTEAR